MKKYVKYRVNTKIRIILLVEILLMFFSFAIYFLTKDSITRFYAWIVICTLMIIVIFKVIIIFIYNITKCKVIKETLANVFNIVLFIGFLILSLNYTIKYYKDIPYVITKEYSVASGRCTKCFVYRGKASCLKVTVDGIEFNVSLGYRSSIKEGENYQIDYLPNSKEVMAVYKN